jgi:6-phosphogluconolactonase
MRELRVESDLVEAAVALFLVTAPRTVALSGGSTPRPVYERLARVEYPWTDVDVFFGDERCVPPDHPASNFRMANEALLDTIPARVHPMVSRVEPGKKPQDEWCDPPGYERELASVFGYDAVPRFDLMFLGLGDDGHTASLFPGDPALEVRDRFVVPVTRPDYDRLTVTYPVLNAARLAVFLVAGASKRPALRQLIDDGDIPAARVRSEHVVVLADEAAGAGLR